MCTHSTRLIKLKISLKTCIFLLFDKTIYICIESWRVQHSCTVKVQLICWPRASGLILLGSLFCEPRMEFFIEASCDKQNIYKGSRYCVFLMSMYMFDYLLAVPPPLVVFSLRHESSLPVRLVHSVSCPRSPYVVSLAEH